MFLDLVLNTLSVREGGQLGFTEKSLIGWGMQFSGHTTQLYCRNSLSPSLSHTHTLSVTDIHLRNVKQSYFTLGEGGWGVELI